jgi:hypothetical protein
MRTRTRLRVLMGDSVRMAGWSCWCGRCARVADGRLLAEYVIGAGTHSHSGPPRAATARTLTSTTGMMCAWAFARRHLQGVAAQACSRRLRCGRLRLGRQRGRLARVGAACGSRAGPHPPSRRSRRRAWQHHMRRRRPGSATGQRPPPARLPAGRRGPLHPRIAGGRRLLNGRNGSVVSCGSRPPGRPVPSRV